MQIVKVVRLTNGNGQKYVRLGIPAGLLKELPDDTTHMTVEVKDGALVYKPLELAKPKGK